MASAPEFAPDTGRSADRANAPRVSAAVVLGTIALLWSLNFFFITLRASLIDLEYQGELIQLRFALLAIAILLTLALWAVLRLFDRFSLTIRIAVAVLVAVPTAMLIGQAQIAIFMPISERISMERAEADDVPLRKNEEGLLEIDTDALRERANRPAAQNTPAPERRGRPTRWQLAIDNSLGHYFILLAWCALYFALFAGERARLAERRAGEFREAARAAELRSLRYQVNPHFLFNTLNSLSAMILTGKNERAEGMVQRIAEFYRQSLTADPTADMPLEEEFALQRTYLELEAVRFPDRLRVEFDLPEKLRRAQVPGMILQPLVENSVKYAVAPHARPVTIRVAAREEYDRLVLTVEDDGPGVPDGSEHGTGIGLANVRQRLEARFGSDAHIVSGPSSSGYATHLRIPLNCHD